MRISDWSSDGCSSDLYDRGRLSLFVDRGLATQAYRLSGSAWTSILPLTFFVGLLAFIPVAIFWSVWAGVGLLDLAIIAQKMLTAKAIARVRKEAIGDRPRPEERREGKGGVGTGL